MVAEHLKSDERDSTMQASTERDFFRSFEIDACGVDWFLWWRVDLTVRQRRKKKMKKKKKKMTVVER